MANGIPVLPGTATPTDIQMALEHGVTAVKFFPAEAYGGAKTIATLAGPFPSVRFVPTGGITREQLPAYLALTPVLAVGGSWFCGRDLLAAKRFDEVAALTAAAVAIVKGARR